MEKIKNERRDYYLNFEKKGTRAGGISGKPKRLSNNDLEKLNNIKRQIDKMSDEDLY